MNAVDKFVIYDNIKYTKKGWINRNRILLNGKDVLISLPIKKDSDFLDVCEREIAGSFNRDKLLNKIKGTYIKAPYFSDTFPLIKDVIHYEDINLFNFIYNSVVKLCKHLSITTEIRKSSDVDIDHSLKGQDKVLALCEAVGAHTYINAIGGIELYSQSDFHDKGVDLKFIKTIPIEYPQFKHNFCPWLSIIDIMMFNSIDRVQRHLSNYELIENGKLKHEYKRN